MYVTVSLSIAPTRQGHQVVTPSMPCVLSAALFCMTLQLCVHLFSIIARLPACTGL